MSYLMMKDSMSEFNNEEPTTNLIFKRCGKQSLYFTEEQYLLIDRVSQSAWVNGYHSACATSAGYSKYGDYQNLVASTIYHYDLGLRGKVLRKQLVKDYGVGIIFILQFAVIIMQIVYWIRELRK